MNINEELKILNHYDKLRFINAMKDLKKNPAIIGVIIFFVIQIALIIYFFHQSTTTTPALTYKSFQSGVYFFIMFITLISFLLGAFTIIISLYEVDFLLPRPVSKRSILLKRILLMYFILIISNIIACFLFSWIFHNTGRK